MTSCHSSHHLERSTNVSSYCECYLNHNRICTLLNSSTAFRVPLPTCDNCDHPVVSDLNLELPADSNNKWTYLCNDCWTSSPVPEEGFGFYFPKCASVEAFRELGFRLTKVFETRGQELANLDGMWHGIGFADLFLAVF